MPSRIPVPHDPNELIALVDSQDHIIGRVPRRNHAGGRLHREASVLIINPKNEILLQVRKDNHMLDYSASGHFPWDQNYLEAAVRETLEELGLRIPKSRFKKVAKRRIDRDRKGIVNHRFVTLFEIQSNIPLSRIRIDPKEVESAKYYSIGQVKRIISHTKQKGGFIEMLQLYLKKKRYL